jgi:hypothetical protein
LTGKVIEGKIADVSARAYAADLGLLYKPSEPLAISATVQNLGSKLTFNSHGDSLPAAYHLGAAYRWGRHWLAPSEGVYSGSGLLSGHFGGEWRPISFIALRAGYKTETTKALSPIAGLTVGLGMHLLGQEFAYAWLPYGDLGNSQYFSLLLRFGKIDEDRKNLIQYQASKPKQTDKKIGPSEEDLDFISSEPQSNALLPMSPTTP